MTSLTADTQTVLEEARRRFSEELEATKAAARADVQKAQRSERQAHERASSLDCQIALLTAEKNSLLEDAVVLAETVDLEHFHCPTTEAAERILALAKVAASLGSSCRKAQPCPTSSS